MDTDSRKDDGENVRMQTLRDGCEGDKDVQREFMSRIKMRVCIKPVQASSKSPHPSESYFILSYHVQETCNGFFAYMYVKMTSSLNHSGTRKETYRQEH